MCGNCLVLPDTAAWSEMRRLEQEHNDAALAAKLGGPSHAYPRATRSGRIVGQELDTPSMALSVWQAPPAYLVDSCMPGLDGRVSCGTVPRK
eukprot:6368453-Prymnesium_polylepis.1